MQQVYVGLEAGGWSRFSGLEGRALSRLYAFGEALATSGGTCMSSASFQSSHFMITEMRIRLITDKCLRIFLMALLLRRNVRRVDDSRSFRLPFGTCFLYGWSR